MYLCHNYKLHTVQLKIVSVTTAWWNVILCWLSTIRISYRKTVLLIWILIRSNPELFGQVLYNKKSVQLLHTFLQNFSYRKTVSWIRIRIRSADPGLFCLVGSESDLFDKKICKILKNGPIRLWSLAAVSFQIPNDLKIWVRTKLFRIQSIAAEAKKTFKLQSCLDNA